MRALIQKIWYESDKTVLWFLYPLSWLYGFFFIVRKELYSIGLLPTKPIPVPLIVVGNITVGGTGKTPVVIALVSYLQSKGFQPGVVSRGYGGNADDFPLLVSSQSPVSETGDEPMLIFKRTGVPVVIDPNRSRAAQLLALDGACDVIVSDDGLQHVAMERDFEIIVIDGQRLFGNEKLLPVGPLREPITRLKYSDLFVLNSPNTESITYVQNLLGFGNRQLVSLELKGEPIKTVGQKTMMNMLPIGERVHAVAAIGNPERFFSSLENLGFTIIRHIFKDHYVYKESDFEFDDDLSIIMTEKDAIKCADFENENLYFLPVSAHLDDSFFVSIDSFLNIK
jgi:tetraacyldisaccharide 4'-kinase